MVLRLCRFLTPSQSSGRCVKLFLLLLSANSILVSLVCGQLPDQLDPFLEKLFEFEECEDFLGSTDYTNIATSKCDPHTCDFPRQICARPAAKFQDSSANICRSIPLECITAANGGVAPGPSIRPTPSPLMPQPSIPNVISPMIPSPSSGASATPPPNPTDPLAICKMGVPNGRFCGFRPMFTYNKETLQCDEFWFPGCRTAETNANLFEDYQQCQKVADMCKPTPPPTFAPFRPRPTHRPHTPPPTPPPPPPPAPAPSPFVDAFKSFGGNGPAGQGALGAIGMFTGSGLGPTGQGPLGNFSPNPNAGAAPAAMGAGGAGGQDGQDLGLFGLIQQGIMGAQAAGKGGNGGKEATAKAAGQILQQFTGFDLGGIGNNFGGLFGR
ncbi:hypothetical protein CAEBREN_07186 [Caenorhabditis brenneri]|uniref:BPTI/Kunitz inhibitor domain-containing protein n=1 Tax=Caenorhabditis brenneri TaxID=135651 RepID=G0PMZ0_CAEBE|nr:hypothetical protein CAEBREN_07186 [Caenorhabditis brenneri]